MRHAIALPASALLSSLLACDPRPLVEVHVAGVTPAVRAIQVTRSLDGRASDNKNVLPPDTARFLLRLPEGARGALDILVAGLQDDGCVISQGREGRSLDGAPLPPIDVVLAPLQLKACRLLVLKEDFDGGSVRVDPTGEPCGTGCFLYSPSTRVRLVAQPAAGYQFLGWQGACAVEGAGSCTVVIAADREARVTARFTPSR